MEIKERIEAIKPYFKTCLMAEDKFLVIVRFGAKWTVPNPKSVMSNYGVKFDINKENGECHFGISMDMDYNIIFDVIESIIKHNKDIEERKSLLEQYHRQLDEIFEDKTVSLDKFKLLRFTITETCEKPSNCECSQLNISVEDDFNTIKANEPVSKDIEPEEAVPIEISENIDNEEVKEETPTVVNNTPKRGRPAKNVGNSLLSKAVNLAKK